MRSEFGETEIYETLRHIRWPNGITCPYCGRSRVTTHSKSPRTPRRKYLCRDCRRTFTDLTQTRFAHTNLPLIKWLKCLHLMRQGLSTSELAKGLAVKWDTAAHMQHRLALDQDHLMLQLRRAAEGKYESS